MGNMLNMKIVLKVPCDFGIDNEYKLEGILDGAKVKATLYCGDRELPMKGTVDVGYTDVLDGVLQKAELLQVHEF